ncbi:TPA: chromosome segregation protein SMC, partial [Candidatus Poribacteria bacterium]|nr:chromosome segregation protein SMC [Candidatus Poribacteria bacterium]
LINQVPSRLRDINELFMDTGIGVDAYSVMEQSKIDLILNARVEDRRQIFDEVAGITKYKHRKKDALKKLEQTEQNISRVNDIIHELERETESLRQQAEQAEKYQKLHQMLKGLELNLSKQEYNRFVKELSETQLNLEEILILIAKAREAIDSTELRIEESTNRQIELDRLIQQGRAVVLKFQSEIEKTERQIVLYKERQLNIQQQRSRAAQAIESLQQQLDGLEAQKQKSKQEQAKIDVAFKLEENRLNARKSTLADLMSRVNQTNQSIEAAQTKRLEETSQISAVERQILSINNRMEYSESDFTRINESLEGLGSEFDTALTTHKESEMREKQVAVELLRIDSQKNQSDQELQKLQTNLHKLEIEIQGSQESLGMSASRLKSLKDLQNTHEGYYNGVRAILKAKEVDAKKFGGVCGVIAELIYTDPDYELAIEVALGSAIQNLVTETAEDAQAGIAFLKEKRAGRVTFLPLDILRPRYFNEDKLLNQPGVIGVAGDLIDCNPKYDVAIDQLLGNTLVVEDIDIAVQLTRKFRPNARLVTLEGDVINTSGAVTGGHTSSKTSGLLSRSRELEDLEKQVSNLNQKIIEKDSQRKKLVKRINELQQIRHKLNTEWQESQIEHKSLLLMLDQSQQKLNQIRQRLGTIEEERANLIEQSEQIEGERHQLESDLKQAQKSDSILLRKVERLMEQVETEKNKLREVEESCQDLQISLATKGEKLQSLSTAITSFDENENQIVESMHNHQKIIDSDEEMKQELTGQIDSAQKRFLELEQEKFESEEKANSLQTERENITESISGSHKMIKKERQQFDKHNRMRHQLEVNTTQLEMQLKGISSKIQDKYQVSIDQIEDENTEHEIDELELVAETEDLKTQIEAIGPINLKAIEDYQEQKKRESFLCSQREDLQKSLDSTYDAIEKINQTSREAFQRTFNLISANFQEVFTELFGGGETKLQLTDESNLLESGVEIIACPPGKRPQNITQLSGGERSLVAIALLFAMFKIKPSPFCVMDEVDAALDESNVLRFTNLIRKYADQTQFIIITHNKRTMETADIIYGVTMEQAGVSKIVSAKFSD